MTNHTTQHSRYRRGETASSGLGDLGLRLHADGSCCLTVSLGYKRDNHHGETYVVNSQPCSMRENKTGHPAGLFRPRREWLAPAEDNLSCCGGNNR